MNIKKFIPHELHDLWALLKRLSYFSLGLLVFLAIAQYYYPAEASNGAATNKPLTLDTTAFVAIGVILTILYIRGMYLILSYASKTYGLEEDSSRTYGETAANKILFFGSFVLVAGSALIISAYGWAPIFLYVGPVLSLLGPLVIIISMEVDLKRYKRQIANRRLENPDGYFPPEPTEVEDTRSRW